MCANKGSLILYCSCAGVFCDKCCPNSNISDNLPFYSAIVPNLEEDAFTSSLRVCDACIRGECPGIPIRDEIRAQIETESNKQGSYKPNVIEKIGSKLAGRVTESLGPSNLLSPPFSAP